MDEIVDDFVGECIDGFVDEGVADLVDECVDEFNYIYHITAEGVIY